MQRARRATGPAGLAELHGIGLRGRRRRRHASGAAGSLRRHVRVDTRHVRLEPLARAGGGVEAEVEVGEQLRHGQEHRADLGVLGLGEGLFEDGAKDGADAGEVVQEGRADGVEVADGDRDEGVNDFARNLAAFAHGGAARREEDHA